MTALLMVVVVITSCVALAIGSRGKLAGLLAATGVVFEVVGATVIFCVVNVVVGVALVLVARQLSIYYTTLYEVNDITLLIVALVQALIVTTGRLVR